MTFSGKKYEGLWVNHLRKPYTGIFFLNRRGYADGEIEALFAKYDVDGDRVLDEGEQKRMQADLEDQKVISNTQDKDI